MSKTIPVRLLQFAGNISISCITALLELILKPISTDLQKLPRRMLSRQLSIHQRPAQLERPPNHNSRNWKAKPVFYIVVADAKALHPSLCRDTVTKALECALEKDSKLNTNAQKILKLNDICRNNVVTQYGDQLYTHKNGIITSDNNSQLNLDSLIRIIKWKHPTSTSFCIC